VYGVSVKDMFRPRLTRKEVRFIAEALKAYAKLMRQKQKEIEHREWRIKRLRDKLVYEGTHHLPELTRERAQLKQDKRQRYYSQQLVASALMRRFEAMAEGGRLHSGMTTYTYLKRLELVPKTLKKT